MDVMSVYAFRAAAADQLLQMALAAHPHSRSHQAKWIRSIRYLRRRRLWIRDGAKVAWGTPGADAA
jgi:hypothetical protein